MRHRKRARGLVLASINVVVILAAAFIVKSLAAGDPGPSSGSFALRPESEFAPLSPVNTRTALAPRGSSSAAAALPAGSQDTSAHVAGAATGSQEPSVTGAGSFDDLWYGQAQSAFSPLPTDSGAWLQSGTSLGGYGSPSSTTSAGRRSGWSPGYAGAGGGGGGFPSGGGTAGNAQNSLTDPGNNAGLRLAGGPAAAAGGAPLLPAQAQGNPLFGGGNPLGGPAFPLVQFPGLGGGSTASVTPLQEPVAVPEPSTALLLGCGLALAAYRKRRRLILPS